MVWQSQLLSLSRPNHVWPADITYIPLARGLVYLFAVLEWASRRVLAWQVSTTLTTDFCLEAVQEAITQHGTPPSSTPIKATSSPTRSSRDSWRTTASRSAWMEKGIGGITFVERLWKSLKYEEVFLRANKTIGAAQQGLECDLTFYNGWPATTEVAPAGWTECSIP
jgi:putative transposase